MSLCDRARSADARDLMSRGWSFRLAGKCTFYAKGAGTEPKQFVSLTSTKFLKKHKTYGTGGYSGSETLLCVGVELKATTTVYQSRKIPIRCGAGPDRIPLRGTRTGVQRVGEFDATAQRGWEAVTRLTEKELADALSTHEVISDTGGTDMRKTEEHKALERRQKYNAVPTVLDGIRFASIKESRRYQQLQVMERAGLISGLELQPRFLLQVAFTDSFGQTHRAIQFTADFRYFRESDRCVVIEDVKGGKATQDAAFSIRWKWAIRLYPNFKFELVGG
jgi:hypothetical protein